MNARTPLLLVALAQLAACSSSSDGADTGTSSGTPGCTDTPKPKPTEVKDRMSYARLLRRAMLVITGTTPTSEDYEKLAALGSDAEREDFIAKAIDTALQSTSFYSKMLELGHEWIKVAEYTTGAVGDAYQGNMSGDLAVCGQGSLHEGAYFARYEYGDGDKAGNVCDDKDKDGNAITAEVNTVEPWWAPQTTVTLVGKAGTKVAVVKDKSGQDVDCGVSFGGYYDPGIPEGCGCGPNLTWCYPYGGLSGGSSYDEAHQRRHPWDEPARLFAHIAWNDRPLSDVILGNYSVGTNMLQALYARMGRQNSLNKTTIDQNSTWWQPAKDKSPRDPLHTKPNDVLAWREFVVSTLNPNILSLTKGDVPSGDLDRSYTYDPRVDKEPFKGLPAAGVLTSMGFLSSFSRERPRAARALEMFACKEFTPPDANIKFPPFDKDPATSGTCINCHQTLDPAAMYFKRWDFGGNYLLPTPFMPDVGPWLVDKNQLSKQYPWSGLPFIRWAETWLPGTVLTPVTQADIDAHPNVVFLDALPKGQTYLGVESDGTVGPFGFAKILVQSGEFDSCAASRLYERVVGRTLDKGKEAFYLKSLAQKFVDGGRKIRPFVKYLMTLEEFRRGI
jgi:hypothetical protein